MDLILVQSLACFGELEVPVFAKVPQSRENGGKVRQTRIREQKMYLSQANREYWEKYGQFP